MLGWFYKGKKLIPLRVGALVVAVVLVGALLMQLQSAGYLKSQVDGVGDYFTEPSPDPVALPITPCQGYPGECPDGMVCAISNGVGECRTPGCGAPGAPACSDSQYCDWLSSSCKDKGERGAACGGATPCLDGLVCITEAERQAGHFLNPDPYAQSYCGTFPVPLPVDPTPVPTPFYACNQIVNGSPVSGYCSDPTKTCLPYQYNVPNPTTYYYCGTAPTPPPWWWLGYNPVE